MSFPLSPSIWWIRQLNTTEMSPNKHTKKKIPDLKRVRPANEVAIKEEWWEKRGEIFQGREKKKKKKHGREKKKKIKNGELG